MIAREARAVAEKSSRRGEDEGEGVSLLHQVRTYASRVNGVGNEAALPARTLSRSHGAVIKPGKDSVDEGFYSTLSCWPVCHVLLLTALGPLAPSDP